MGTREWAVLLCLGAVARVARGGDAAGGVMLERLLAIGACGAGAAAPSDCDAAWRALDDPDPTLRLAGALALERGASKGTLAGDRLERAIAAAADDELVRDSLSAATRRSQAGERQPVVRSPPSVTLPIVTVLGRAVTPDSPLPDGVSVEPALVDHSLAQADPALRTAIVRAASARWRDGDDVPPRLLREAVRLAGEAPALEDVDAAFMMQGGCGDLPLPLPTTAELAYRLAARAPASVLVQLGGDSDPGVARAARIVLAATLSHEPAAQWDPRLLLLARDADAAVAAAGLLGLRASLEAWAIRQRDDSETAGPRDRKLLAEAARSLASPDGVLRHAAAKVILERLEMFRDLDVRADASIPPRAEDPPSTRALLAAIRFARAPSRTSLREALQARIGADDGRPGRLRFMLADRLPDWQGDVAAIMSSSQGALFVEACRHSGGMSPERVPVEACAARLASADEEVRVSAAACLCHAEARALAYGERILAAVEKAPTRREQENLVRLGACVSRRDVAMHERLAGIARRRAVDMQLDPLHGLSGAQLAAALSSQEPALRLRAVEASVRDAPSFGAALRKAASLIDAHGNAEGEQALLALVSRPDRDFDAIEGLDLSRAAPVVRGKRIELLALYRRDPERDDALARAAMHAAGADERRSGLLAARTLRGNQASLAATLCGDGDPRVRAELAFQLGAGAVVDGDDRAQADCAFTLLSSDAAAGLAYIEGAGRRAGTQPIPWNVASVVRPLVLRRARAADVTASVEVSAGLRRLAGE